MATGQGKSSKLNHASQASRSGHVKSGVAVVGGGMDGAVVVLRSTRRWDPERARLIWVAFGVGYHNAPAYDLLSF